ncbi:class I SAM-dependent methyltransferase [Leptospira borgpetersenii serovar Tarassovi]|nr:class I SAM-dependent methyltransferase [Leptospira borgpetersenii serovar Tarassovi]MBE8402064.1 class I SAM-dependent methyltransferase [Leptospira borgpetersenii serovar Tarassovi]MBE8406328.1 class I SAM-dependent methyltransferase [Leptospira borgpetersenii serovar Tarassovi]MBE8413934.1 class I SAM-dependent methyltransferase [Leptospira borgpetersenii serovar Tarassovi]MBE8414912.1 class I SAM-dependent methyltransferase [Leptospira borgpetersenii serovar Tarassovi]
MLKYISKQMIERYSKRLSQLGYDVRTLGWGSLEQQRHRFMQTLCCKNFANDKSILDIGCGFGDYLAYLIEKKIPFKNYEGIDINPDLIDQCVKIWEDRNFHASFRVENIAESDKRKSIANIGIMLGLLNLNHHGKIDNYNYSFNLIKNAFSLVSETLIVDFLSSKLTSQYPKEEFVFYHDPSVILEFALNLTSNVVLKHDYAPIPQKEFMLFLYK